MTNIKTTTTKTNHYFRAALAMLAMLAAMLLVSGAALAATNAFFGSSFQIRDNDTASAYPSSIPIQNLSGKITDVNLTLDGYHHAFPDDVDVLLVGPGQDPKKALLMSDVGGVSAVPSTKLTLDDEASVPLPDGTQINQTLYKPTQGTSPLGQGHPVPADFPGPAPAGPYATSLSAFDGTDPNGTWKLFVIDDSGGSSGAVDNNWELQISTQTPPPDTTSPKVTGTSPKPGATGVSPTATVRATFSEEMDGSTVNGATVELFKKGSTTKVAATVAYGVVLSPDGTAYKAILDPANPLKSGTTYKAVVSTGAKDAAGNQLDQNPTKTGNQPKAWFFTVK